MKRSKQVIDEIYEKLELPRSDKDMWTLTIALIVLTTIFIWIKTN